ncbi:MAG TPA: UPF0149 family protein [Luteimonas sp.]|nr:UPF0149 family protein [Luteimonas sp.]
MTGPILHGDRLDALGDLLERRAVPFRGLDLEALDGFLSALAVGPDAVPLEEWQPLVWGGTTPRWNDAEEAAEVAGLLQAHVELALQRACHDGDSLPDRLLPLVWLPEDPDAEQADALDLGRAWAEGFLRAVALREAAWDAWFDAAPWIEEIAMLVERLATGEVTGEDPAAPPTALDDRERLDIIASLPGMLSDLQHHRIEALTPRTPVRRADRPERNAPCPCGSGRKYKKCCAA